MTDPTIKQRVSEFLRLHESGAPASTLDDAFSRIVESTQGTPGFELVRQILPALQKAQQAQLLLSPDQFRLPGTGIIVHDRREEPPQGKPTVQEEPVKPETKDEGKKTQEAVKEGEKKKAEAKEKEGKKVEGKEAEAKLGRGVSNSFSPEQLATKQRLHHVYELIRRVFEENFEVAKRQAEGKTALGDKSDAGWKEFFQSLSHRTIGKLIDFSLVNGFRFRGLVPKGDGAIVISDLLLKNGEVEKFIRFKALADLMNRLTALTPGESFGKEGFEAEKFAYLALKASRGLDLVQSQKASQGKFLSEQMEQRVALELGIAQKPSLPSKGKGVKRRLGGAGGFVDPDAAPEETPYQFVPWWHWGNLARPGKWKWTTVIFYLSLLAIALVGIGTMTLRFLP